MDWINLHQSTMRDPAFLAASASERGVWLSVMAYACHIECGGVLVGAASWKDRQWQVTCGVSLREVCKARSLLQESGGNILIIGYPIQKEKQVKQARSVARDGAFSRWNGEKAKSETMPTAMPTGMPTGNGVGNAEGKGKEGKGREGEAKPAPGPETQANQDPFQDHKPTPPPTNPKPMAINPADLLATLGTYLDWFRGNEEGRQEARDAMAGALELYDHETIRATLVESFKENRRKTHVRDLLDVLDAKAHSSAPAAKPLPEPCQRMSRVFESLGLKEIQARTNRPDLTEADMMVAITQAPEWCREVAALFPEIP